MPCKTLLPASINATRAEVSTLLATMKDLINLRQEFMLCKCDQLMEQEFEQQRGENNYGITLQEMIDVYDVVQSIKQLLAQSSNAAKLLKISSGHD